MWSTPCNKPVQPRMHFLLAPACAGTCAHTDSAVLTDAGARSLHARRSHKISPAARHNVCMPPTYCRAPRERDARRTSIISKTRKKKSHESQLCYRGESYSRFFLLCKTTPTVFRYNRPCYVKMHKDNIIILPFTTERERGGGVAFFLFE